MVVSVLGIALEEIITKDFKINPSVVRGVRMLRVVRGQRLSASFVHPNGGVPLDP